jgi:GntR family transcriptional regulator
MIPAYKKIKNSLAGEIRRGRYSPGDALPSEAELITKWSLSRITVRNAIKELAREGLTYTIQGKGTFVAEPPITNLLPTMTSYSFDVTKRGMTPSCKLLCLERIEVDKTLASRLQISPGSVVIHFDRLLLADAKPVSLCYTYIPVAAVAPHQDAFKTETLSDVSFYRLLSDLGVHLTGGEQSSSASAATAGEAKLLDVEEGSPLIYSRRIAHTEEKTIIEYSKILSRPDRTQWKVQLSAPVIE